MSRMPRRPTLEDSAGSLREAARIRRSLSRAARLADEGEDVLALRTFDGVNRNRAINMIGAVTPPESVPSPGEWSRESARRPGKLARFAADRLRDYLDSLLGCVLLARYVEESREVLVALLADLAARGVPPDLLRELEKAIQTGDPEQVRQVAQKIKRALTPARTCEHSRSDNATTPATTWRGGGGGGLRAPPGALHAMEAPP